MQSKKAMTKASKTTLELKPEQAMLHEQVLENAKSTTLASSMQGMLRR